MRLAFWPIGAEFHMSCPMRFCHQKFCPIGNRSTSFLSPGRDSDVLAGHGDSSLSHWSRTKLPRHPFRVRILHIFQFSKLFRVIVKYCNISGKVRWSPSEALFLYPIEAERQREWSFIHSISANKGCIANVSCQTDLNFLSLSNQQKFLCYILFPVFEKNKTDSFLKI